MSHGDDSSGPRQRLILFATSRPALARHVRLRFDEVRQRWMMLAPERLLTPSETAVAVLQLCDGQKSIDDLAAALAADFDAPRDAILADILPVLQDLADKGYIRACRDR